MHKIIFSDWFWEGIYTNIPPVATPWDRLTQLGCSLLGGMGLDCSLLGTIGNALYEWSMVKTATDQNGDKRKRRMSKRRQNNGKISKTAQNDSMHTNGRPKIVRCLFDKKTIFRLVLHATVATVRVRIAPKICDSQLAPENILWVLLISSKLVHCRRSYTRTREHHQNGPYNI